MKKHLLFSSAAVVAVAGLAFWASAADYSTNYDSDVSTHTGRYTSQLTVTDDKGSTLVVPVQDGLGKAVYVDKTADCVFTTEPGATVTVTPSGSGEWMHNYLYVDWANDGFVYSTQSDYVDGNGPYTIKEGADIVAFCAYGGPNESSWYNSNGESIANNVNGYVLPLSFTVPADLAPGEYRVRFKVDWNELDPKGHDHTADNQNSVANNGGCIADFTLVIAGETEPEQPEEPGEVDYDLSSLGNHNGNNAGARYLTYVNLSAEGSEAVAVGPIGGSVQPDGGKKWNIYHDLSAQQITVEIGKTMTVEVQGVGALLQSYVYVDWGKDGFKYEQPSDLVNVENSVPLEGSDLVAHNGWSKDGTSGTFYDSKGEVVPDRRNLPYPHTFEVLIPEGTKPGLYRGRVKAALCSLDPNGGVDTGGAVNNITDLLGTIVDFTIEVVDEMPGPDPIDPATLVEFTNPVGTDAEWTVTTCCHADNGEGANGQTEQMTDGDKTNFWHIAYDGSDAAMRHTGHHYFTIDTKEVREIGGFNWTARTQAPSATALGHGLLRAWEIYVADNADEFAFADNAAMEAYRASHEAAAAGTCDVQYDNNEFSVTFTSLVKGQYFLFVATEVGEKGDWIHDSYEYLHCCEFSFLAAPVKVAEPVLAYNTLAGDLKWTVETFCCDEPNNEGSNGFAAKMIDNNPNTFYHSNWSQYEYGKEVNNDNPRLHYFVIDLKVSQDVYGIEYTHRNTTNQNGLWRSVKVFASDNAADFGFRNQIDGYTVNKENHTAVSEMALAYATEHAEEGRVCTFTVTPGGKQSVMFDAPLTGRYLFVVVDDTATGHNVIGELGFYLDEEVYNALVKESVRKAKTSQLDVYMNNVPGGNEIISAAVAEIMALPEEDFDTAADAVLANTRTALQGALDGLATSGKLVVLKNVRRASLGKAAYLACAADSVNTVEAPGTNTEAYWAVEASGENFVLRNYGRNAYASLVDGEKYFKLSENAEDAGVAPFSFTLKDNGTVAMTMASTMTYNMDTNGNGLTYYYSPDAGEEWSLAYASDVAETVLVYNNLANDLKWTIADFCCDEPSKENPNGTIDKAIDNNLDTYYMSDWGRIEYRDGVHFFVVDRKTSLPFYGIDYKPRGGKYGANGVWRQVSVFASDNEADFDFTGKVDGYEISKEKHQAVSDLVSAYATEHSAEGRDCTFTIDGTSSDTESVMFDVPLAGRYVLFVVKETGSGHNVVGELGLYYDKADYESLLNGQNEKQEKLEVIEKKINEVIALAETYQESVPFAGLETIIESFKNAPAELYLDYYDELDEFVAQALVAPIEEVVLQALNDNVADKVWTLYQPGQNGYLCATTKATNKGYDSFNYQGSANENSQWTLVAGETEGQFYLRSSKGQYIGTPAQNYCRVEDTVENAGLFTLGVKEGYVTFNSVAFEGCGLGLDGKNDPAEIMTLEDGSFGYRWQVTVADKPEPVEPVAVDMVVTPEAGLQESIGSIQFYIADAEYSINAEVTEPVTLTKGTATLHSLDNAELAKHYSEKGQMYYLDVNLTENGTYVLTIPEAKFKGETVYNNKTVVTWTINNNGITSVTVNGEEVEAYDLQGRRVQKVGKGLYIVNGVKTLVK